MKTRISFVRNHKDAPRFGVWGNYGFGKINRIDRELLGVVYIVIAFGSYKLDITRQLRPFKPISVGERGVW